ncbi:MAG: hypothetical protein QW566_05485 [Candidatus Jordarchaeales archaeon]
MPFRVLKWGLRNPRRLVKAYTVFFILWTMFWIIVMITIPIYYLSTQSYDSASLFSASLIILLFFILPPFIPLYYYYRKSFKVSPKPPVAREEKVLDPYLVSVREKFADAESYFRGEKVQWGPVIVDMFDAVMLVLQRLVIDLKGVAPIESLRKEKKLYFDVLANILDKEGVLKPEDRKELEILKDLRNRIVHEDYRPSKEHALWAYNVVKRFISKHYDEVFK